MADFYINVFMDDEKLKKIEAAGLADQVQEIDGKFTNSYHKRLAYLEGLEIVKLAEYAKRKKISHSNLINKAHRQTIEAFLEKGVWKIGIL